jgi:hypothetical protein
MKIFLIKVIRLRVVGLVEEWKKWLRCGDGVATLPPAVQESPLSDSFRVECVICVIVF